jgi:hypothetical protein
MIGLARNVGRPPLGCCSYVEPCEIMRSIATPCIPCPLPLTKPTLVPKESIEDAVIQYMINVHTMCLNSYFSKCNYTRRRRRSVTSSISSSNQRSSTVGETISHQTPNPYHKEILLITTHP